MEELSTTQMVIDALLGLGLFLGFILYSWITKRENKNYEDSKKVPYSVKGGEKMHYESTVIIKLGKKNKKN
jgi:hypothetical protein